MYNNNLYIKEVFKRIIFMFINIYELTIMTVFILEKVVDVDIKVKQETHITIELQKNME